MPIKGVTQPELLDVDDGLRLRKYDGMHAFALPWYQDVDTVYLVDGVREPYDLDKLEKMYRYLDSRGELYFIEVFENGAFIPVGDVTIWQEDMPIVIGSKAYRGKGIGKRVIARLIQRGKALGYPALYVNEIYRHNTASQKTFESLGFKVCAQTPDGFGYCLRLEKADAAAQAVTVKSYPGYSADEILPLYKAVGWRNYYEKPDMLKAAYAHSLCAFAAYIDDQLVGVIRAVGDGCSILYIQDILVLPEYQRQGIGRLLLSTVLENYRHVYQKVLLTDNQPATIPFYESLGFKPADQLHCVSFVCFSA